MRHRPKFYTDERAKSLVHSLPTGLLRLSVSCVQMNSAARTKTPGCSRVFALMAPVKAPHASSLQGEAAEKSWRNPDCGSSASHRKHQA